MPTYVYRCRKCDKTFTAVQGVNDEPLTECVYIDSDGPCIGGRVYRVIQPVGVTYNGSGFHCTDYGKSGRKAPSYKDYSSE